MATNVQELPMPDKSGQEMVTTTMIVTPQQAQAWLDAMPSQRRVRQNKILALTRQVVEGRWKLTPHGLVFDRDGMLMISDETITGFRFGASCAQGYYGYKPDLTILGKAVGGGTPFAALAGTKAAFAKILSGEVVHAGTLNGNPLCLAASKWSLDEVLAQGASFPAATNALGRRLTQARLTLSQEGNTF